MLFLMIAKDKPGHADLRMETRPTHLEFLKANSDKIKLGGPFQNDEGVMVGSMLVFDMPSKGDVEALIAQDPYSKAGLFESVEVSPWVWGVGNPEA